MGYVALNAKYFKDTKAKSEMGHVERLFKENKNAFSELTKNNFGSSESLYKDYLNIKNEALDDLRKKGKKGFQKNSNTFIDCALIFDREIFKKLIDENRQDEIKKTTNEFMLEFEQKFGFAPVGFEFHLDEGHEHDGEIKNNFHAHAIFLNYDFKKGVMPLRNMNKKHWEQTQDLIHKHFKKYGFERGVSKKLTGAKHKKKLDYQQDIINEQKEEISKLEKDLLSKISENNRLNDEIIQNYEAVLVSRKILENYKEKEKAVKTIKKFIEKNKSSLINLDNHIKSKLKGNALNTYEMVKKAGLKYVGLFLNDEFTIQDEVKNDLKNLLENKQENKGSSSNNSSGTRFRC